MADSGTQGAGADVAGAPDPGAPGIVAEVRADGTGYVTIDGVREDVVGSDMADVGSQITGRIATHADSAGQPLTAEVRDPDGTWMLLVHPDGRVEEAPDDTPTSVPVVSPSPVTLPVPEIVAPPASTPVPAPLPARGRTSPAVGQPFSGPQLIAPPLSVARSIEDALLTDYEPEYRPSIELAPASEYLASADTSADATTSTYEPEYLSSVKSATSTYEAEYVSSADSATSTYEPGYVSSADSTTSTYEPEYVSSAADAATDHDPEYHPAVDLSETVAFASEEMPRPAEKDYADYPATPEPAPATSSASDPEPSLGDLLAPRRTRQQAVATEGPRAWIRILTGGKISPRPGEKERRHLAAMETIRRPLDGPRTIVVVNPKGGVHKTTTTLMLAATLGQQRGGYALAWDNNETHGTLGWRSTAKGSGGTALDLLAALPELQALGDLRVGDLGPYMRSQGTEQFDVLASDDDAASGAFVDAHAFNDLHAMVTRFYRTIVIDTGNNIRASNWRAAVEAADRLVLVTTVREDSAQAAAWAVEALRAAGLADVVRSAVTILSSPERRPEKDLHERLRQHFGGLTRTVVEVPFDQALVSGGPVDVPGLRPATREAWLQAAAAVIDGL
ncbi:MAG: hypothetical protein FWF02_07075 [Micrococcales bacterium]|nr:hypothetical protein [Micrococcales bacterium]MCL2667453.1 hypothetical protein [Micrococcales bacterium]